MYRFIYLAAGFSRRFGGNKLLTDCGGKPMFSRLLMELLDLTVSGEAEADITAVTQYEEILAWCREKGEECLTAVVNPDPGRGIASSLRCGIEAAAQKRAFHPEDRLVCFVADQPALTGREVLAFLKACEENGARLACCGDGEGELGNPCLFAPEYVPELLALQGDKGGKRVILKHMEDVFIFRGLPDGALRDIDTLAGMTERLVTRGE